VPSSGSSQPTFSGTFPADAGAIRDIRDQVAEIALACGVTEEDVYGVRLGVTEAATNAIVHAYGQREPREGDEIRVEVFHVEDELLIVIADNGTGLAPRLESPGLGIGLPMVASMALRLELVSAPGGGTEVHMAFPCRGEVRAPCV
jgi:serine/threonine-protein kinase RsbW/stage II sporulation protein AB (anti-sigma F factor)